MSQSRLVGNMNEEQYKLISARRIAQDNLIWQTPTLATAAQAFLLAAAFNSQTSITVARLLFAFSFFVGAASIQLMIKHRYHERIDSELLSQFEEQHEKEGYSILPGPKGSVDLIKRNFLTHVKSFQLWVVVLTGFCLIAVYGFYLKL